MSFKEMYTQFHLIPSLYEAKLFRLQFRLQSGSRNFDLDHNLDHFSPCKQSMSETGCV